MTLDRLRPVADRALGPFVTAADRVGLSPDGVSVVAFGVALAAGGAFALGAPGWYLLGAGLVFVNGWLDLVDGALARRQDAASSGGDLLDHVLDRYADIAMVVGVAAGIDRYALGVLAITGVLMTSYLGTQIQAVGLGREYGGLVGRADRLALTGVAAALTGLRTPPVLGLAPVGWLLVLLAVVGHATALQRFYGAWRDLD
ncbi:MAG: CDP-alcohol phosphatidyltransferase family protein [Haloferacaceae archaeon]